MVKSSCARGDVFSQGIVLSSGGSAAQLVGLKNGHCLLSKKMPDWYSAYYQSFNHRLLWKVFVNGTPGVQLRLTVFQTIMRTG